MLTATTYDTNKIGSGILQEYEEFFKTIKNNRIKYLEIGIRNGGSLKWARDFFQNGLIYGIDLNFMMECGERIKTFSCNQNNTRTLNKIGKKYGEFDIIIDDASHRRIETENTFNTLWKYLKSGGWYVIEDWHIGFCRANYYGLPDLITGIILRKNQLKIGRLLVKINKYSLAYFQKTV